MTGFIQCCDEEEDHAVVEILPMTLTKPEEVVLDTLRPIWFERKHGYQGTTHEEAELFCQSVGQFNLCPEEAVRSRTSISFHVWLTLCVFSTVQTDQVVANNCTCRRNRLQESSGHLLATMMALIRVSLFWKPNLFAYPCAKCFLN